jgi:hypothetical protein
MHIINNVLSREAVGQNASPSLFFGFLDQWEQGRVFAKLPLSIQPASEDGPKRK